MPCTSPFFLCYVSTLFQVLIKLYIWHIHHNISFIMEAFYRFCDKNPLLVNLSKMFFYWGFFKFKIHMYPLYIVFPTSFTPLWKIWRFWHLPYLRFIQFVVDGIHWRLHLGQQLRTQVYGRGHIPLADVSTGHGQGVSDSEQQVREMVCLGFQERLLSQRKNRSHEANQTFSNVLYRKNMSHEASQTFMCLYIIIWYLV